MGGHRGFAALAIVINQTFSWPAVADHAHVAAILSPPPVFVLGASIAWGASAPTREDRGIALAAGGALLVVGGEGLPAMKSLIGDLLIVGNSLAYACISCFPSDDGATLGAARDRADVRHRRVLCCRRRWRWHQAWNAIPAAWIGLGW